MHLSRHVILREIAHTLDLQVHGFGITVDDSGLQMAWLDIDVPPCCFLAHEGVLCEGGGHEL